MWYLTISFFVCTAALVSGVILLRKNGGLKFSVIDLKDSVIDLLLLTLACAIVGILWICFVPWLVHQILDSVFDLFRSRRALSR